MVRELREQGAIRSGPVAAALATVPRHLFAPGEPLEAAYAPQGIVMAKRGPDGLALSVMSAAHLQAVMLERAGFEPGMRVLEVGSGGYNAALIQEITGESGQVTTVDIDADITDRARGCLAAAGYGGVNVVLADAEGGVPEGCAVRQDHRHRGRVGHPGRLDLAAHAAGQADRPAPDARPDPVHRL